MTLKNIDPEKSTTGIIDAGFRINSAIALRLKTIEAVRIYHWAGSNDHQIINKNLKRKILALEENNESDSLMIEIKADFESLGERGQELYADFDTKKTGAREKLIGHYTDAYVIGRLDFGGIDAKKDTLKYFNVKMEKIT